jgi:hypothetical protein
MSNHVELVRYDKMCHAIDAAHEVDEVKDIRDKALALETYARQANNMGAERRAAEIRMRAERKAGQLLAGTVKKGGDRKSKSSRATLIMSALKANGISRDQSAHWQRLAKVPSEQFEAVLRNGDKPSTKGILRQTEPPKRRVASPAGLWLWETLRDFERDRLLAMSPDEVMEDMLASLRDDIHRLAPQVAKWLKRIGEIK